MRTQKSEHELIATMEEFRARFGTTDYIPSLGFYSKWGVDKTAEMHKALRSANMWYLEVQAVTYQSSVVHSKFSGNVNYCIFFISLSHSSYRINAGISMLVPCMAMSWRDYFEQLYHIFVLLQIRYKSELVFNPTEPEINPASFEKQE